MWSNIIPVVWVGSRVGNQPCVWLWAVSHPNPQSGVVEWLNAPRLLSVQPLVHNLIVLFSLSQNYIHISATDLFSKDFFLVHDPVRGLVISHWHQPSDISAGTALVCPALWPHAIHPLSLRSSSDAMLWRWPVAPSHILRGDVTWQYPEEALNLFSKQMLLSCTIGTPFFFIHNYFLPAAHKQTNRWTWPPWQSW